MYFYNFCVTPFDVPNNGTVFPRALHPLHTTSSDSLPPTMLTLGWLLCFPFMFRPLKANATPIALFFDGVCVGISNKGTGCGTAKPDHGHLAWDHRSPRRHVLWVPLTYPWRERATPLGDRAVAHHAGCCVFLCFCVSSWTKLLANQLVAIDGGKVTNKQTLLHCKYKATMKIPRYYYMSRREMIQRDGT